ncbi:MAG: hypothetical protein JNM66_16505 [Bryobacterales bacterium]|nr:hypothetical protein [Bryobacterales bacterium]
MQTETKKLTRSEQARINGAKSRGPKTPEGLERARTASIIHGLYTQDPTLSATFNEVAYEELRAQYQSVWNPSNRYIADKVDDLVAIRWELNRLREVRRQYLARVFNDVQAIQPETARETSVVTETEVQANAQSGALDRFDLRIRRCQLELSRIEKDILRVSRHFSANGGSQERPAEDAPAAETAAPDAPPPPSETAHTDESPLPMREAGSKKQRKLFTFQSKRRRRQSNLPS